MKISISKQLIGVLALLCSSAGFGATVTVVASNTSPLPGSSFFVTIFGSGFPTDVGGGEGVAAMDVNLTFNGTILTIPIPTDPAGMVIVNPGQWVGGTFFSLASPFLSGSPLGIQLGAPFASTPGGNFGGLGVIRINFNVSPSAIPGTLANIVLSDRDGWIDAVNFVPYSVNYTQANVIIGGAVIPVPAAAWLFVSALGGLAGFRRRYA